MLACVNNRLWMNLKFFSNSEKLLKEFLLSTLFAVLSIKTTKTITFIIFNLYLS